MALKKVATNFCYPGLNENDNRDWNGNFCFIQAADTQFGLIDNFKGTPENERVWTEEIELTKLAIKKAHELVPKPKFFVVCGDLIDAFPETLNREAQVKDMKEVFKDLDDEIPLICVCGNHDVGNSPTTQSLQKYRNDFGDYYFTFWVGGIFFIVINSQFYEDASQVPVEDEEHSKWLEKQLEAIKTNNCKHAVVFQHIPWFIADPYEEKQYFNIDKEKRITMLEKFHKAGVKYIFCGHYHRNAGGKYKDVELITTSAIGYQLGNDKSGMRLVRVTENEIDHKYFALDDFPSTVNLDEKL